MITIIAAFADQQVIGINNQLPWHLPADLSHFRTLTWGYPIVMGRKTYESIGKPLPGRENIVLSQTMPDTEGVTVVRDPIELLKHSSDKPLFIIGGAKIYEWFLPYADRMILTRIEKRFEGDAYFPTFSLDHWRVVRSSDEKYDSFSDTYFYFEEWQRTFEVPRYLH